LKAAGAMGNRFPGGKGNEFPPAGSIRFRSSLLS